MDASIRKYIAELIGTLVLTLFGCGTAVLVGCGNSGGIFATAFAFGVTVMVMSVTVGNISGCHLNPAISIAMFCDKKLTTKDLVGYVVCQIIGAIIAGAILIVILSGYYDCSIGDLIGACDDGVTLGSNLLWGVNDSIASGLLVEIVLTFFFVLVVFGATSKRGMEKFAGFFIGLALTMVHLVGISLTGTSVNPARSIGVAIFAQGDAIGDLWVFIVAPIIGGILAWAVWKYVLKDPEQD